MIIRYKRGSTYMGIVFFITILKGIGMYVLALFLTRKIGTKLISQMDFFDFIMAISMGSIVANAIIDKQFATLSATTTLILFAILTVFTRYLSLKNFTLKKLINSEPVTIIENGIILDENMKKMKWTINELKMK